MPRGSRPPAGPTARRIAEILRGEMKAAGITQAAAGRVLGESQTQVSKYMRGELALNVDQVEALCRLAGIDVHELLRRVGADKGED